MLKPLIFLFLLTTSLIVSGQQVFYEDIFKGGVSCGGYNPVGFPEPFDINVHIDPGSTILKAYLFIMTLKKSDATLLYNSSIVFNGNVLQLNWNNVSNYSYQIETAGHTYEYSFLNFDVTSLVNSFQNNYTVIPAAGQDPSAINGFFDSYYLYVTYENITMPTIGSKVILNEQNAQQLQIYNLSLPANLIDPIAFAFNSTSICNSTFDGSFVKIDGSNLGLVGGDGVGEPQCSGVRGEFYYENGLLYALADDTANNTMNGVDALASIESYISNPYSFNIEFEYQTLGGSGDKTNAIHQLYFAYTTPCQSFPVTTPKDTTVCQNSTLQLNATGGTPNTHSTSGYEWQPATGLSCTDCPNPIFTADSSMFYTVRIWNTDSCSVVRPLKINVRPQPVWDTVTVDSTICGASTGSATLFAQPNNSIVQSWTEVGGLTQTTNVFQNLSGGNHTFYFTDTNGCQSADTLIFIPSNKPTVASFTANPISGASPLSVDFVNTSQQATNYAWSVNGINLGNSLPNFVFDSTGNYWVELVAWQNSPFCADTFVLQIIAYDSLVLQIPNVFSPNGDGTNDAYTLTSNVPVSVDYSIVNRWGQTMIAQTVQFGPGKTVLWDALNSSTELTEGTYFYVIEATPTFDNGVIGKTVKLSGFLQLVR